MTNRTDARQPPLQRMLSTLLPVGQNGDKNLGPLADRTPKTKEEGEPIGREGWEGCKGRGGRVHLSSNSRELPPEGRRKAVGSMWQRRFAHPTLAEQLARRLGPKAPLSQRAISLLLAGFSRLPGSCQQKILKLCNPGQGAGTEENPSPDGQPYWLGQSFRLPKEQASLKLPNAQAKGDPTGLCSPAVLAAQTYFALVVKLAVRLWLAPCQGENQPWVPVPEPEELEALERGQNLPGQLLGLKPQNAQNPFGWYLRLRSTDQKAFWAEVVSVVHAELGDLLGRWRVGPPAMSPKKGRHLPRDFASRQILSAPAEEAVCLGQEPLGKSAALDPAKNSSNGFFGQGPLGIFPSAEWAEWIFRDHFQQLYQKLLSSWVRRRWGEYPTPDELARYVVGLAGYGCLESGRLLDPACGTGSFLMAALYVAWQQRQQVVGGALDPRERTNIQMNICPPTPPSLLQAPKRANTQACAESSYPSATARAGACSGGAGWLKEAIGRIVGWDRSAAAVLAARANWVLALGPWLAQNHPIQLPVFLRDALSPSIPKAMRRAEERFDFLVGNPPWVVWDRLEAQYREATEPLWRHYGLFSLSGPKARHGGAKKDLAALFTYVAADRYLQQGGRLAMLLPNSLLQTQGAGDGFRRFCLPDGTPLKVAKVEDFSSLRLFAHTVPRTVVLLLEKGKPTVYPVPYLRHRPRHDSHLKSSGTSTRKDNKGKKISIGSTPPDRCLAEPIVPAQPSSPWWIRPATRKEAATQAICQRWVGPADYVAYLGANTGGANELFWFELIGWVAGKAHLQRWRAQRRSRPTEKAPSLFCSAEKTNPAGSDPVDRLACAELQSGEELLLEPDWLFPLLRWADVHSWRARPSCWILLVQDVHRRRGIDPHWLQSHCPATWEYLKGWEHRLRRRAAYRRYQSQAPFYSLYNVGPYTLSPFKVVWRRMDRQLRAAVVQPLQTPWGPRPIIPQETCTFIPTETPEEAYYLSALLNSRWVNQLVQATALPGSKGFGSPGILRWVRLEKFDPVQARHRQLAELACQAHHLCAEGKDPTAMQEQIDLLLRR